MIALLMTMQAISTAAALPVLGTCSVVQSQQTQNASTIHAVCGSQGVWLGRAERARSVYNPVLGSLLVITSNSSVQRVKLVSKTGGGGLHVDDVTRDLNKLSGRYVEKPLEAAIDITGFALTGKIKVDKQASGGSAELDLGPLVQLAADSTESVADLIGSGSNPSGTGQ